MANDDDTSDTRGTRDTNKADRPGEYEVGYGRPPEHTRFRPGQSGNPRGRPKRAAPAAGDLAGTIIELLDERIELMRGGQPVRMTARRAIAHQVVNRAVKGDSKALDFLRKLLGTSLGRPEDQIHLDQSGALSETDAEVVARALRRMSSASDDNSDQGGTLQ
jgi:hypothetical protein